jgi:hypothetical protein
LKFDTTSKRSHEIMQIKAKDAKNTNAAPAVGSGPTLPAMPQHLRHYFQSRAARASCEYGDQCC